MLVLSLIFLVVSVVASLKLVTLRDPLLMLVLLGVVAIGGILGFDFAPLPLKSVILIGLMTMGTKLL